MFAQCKENIICLISISKFNVLPDFICARAIASIWSNCLGVNILGCLWSVALAAWSKILESPFPCFPFGNTSHSKALKFFCLPNIIAF